MKILLVRHGESAGNVEPAHYLEVADHAISLSPAGHAQAGATGEFLSEWIPQHWGDVKARVWTSPYRRTRETADHIIDACGPHILDQREHILLAEQQFGLFDGLSDEETQARYPDEWAHYQRCQDFNGRFWARMPLGESRFDVAARVHQAFGTFQRDASRHGVEHLIVSCHGTTLRAFTMMWCHHPFEWFEEERNPGNAAVRYLDGERDAGYLFTPE